METIPKILHFNWIGSCESIPPCGKWCMDLISKMNPSFKVDFFNISIDDFFNKCLSSNMVERLTYLNMLKSVLYEQSGYFNDILKCLETKSVQELNFWDIRPDRIRTNLACKISERFRYKRLCEFGGIWCDLDCFPMRPFDDKLLSCEHSVFISEYVNPSGDGVGKQDINFMGTKPSPTLMLTNAHSVKIPDIRYNSEEMIRLSKKFHQMTLTRSDVEESLLRMNVSEKEINDLYVFHLYNGDKFGCVK